MDTKTTAIVAHITLIGWLIAYLTGDKEGAKFHLNQTLAIYLLAIPGAIIPCIGWIWDIFLLVCLIISLIGALNEEEREVPIASKITLLK